MKELAKALSKSEMEELKHGIDLLLLQDEIFQNTIIEMMELPEESKEGIEDYVKSYRAFMPAKLVAKISSEKLRD